MREESDCVWLDLHPFMVKKRAVLARTGEEDRLGVCGTEKGQATYETASGGSFALILPMVPT